MEGIIPTFCLEIDDIPGENFAEQIKYRRNWYELVDGVTSNPFESTPDELIYNLPILSGLSSFLPADAIAIPSKKPQFLSELEDRVVRYKSTLTLKCKVAMKPEYSVSWKGPAMKSNRCNVVAKGDELSLQIHELQIADSGQYTVAVEGSEGASSSFAWVTVVGEPGVPATVTCLSMKRNAVKLNWKKPTKTTNSLTIWYAVEYKKRDMTKFDVILSGIEQTEAVITGLESISYLFRVFAYNEFFAGSPSEPITVDPPDDLSDWNSQIDIREASISSQQIDFFDETFSQFFSVDEDSLLGRGRSSVVHQATCRVSGRWFALKYFDRVASENIDEHRPDIARELQILSFISHPNLVEYFGAARTEHHFIIIMKRVDGLSALRYVCTRGFISETLMQALCKQLLSGLQFLHSHNIAHLDVRPENLLVEDRHRLPHLTLIDFGSARHSCSELAVWEGGEIEYAAPEQLAHRPSTKSDIWSLGVFLWVLAFGQSPFESFSEDTMKGLILHAILPPLDVDMSERYTTQLLDMLFEALQLELEYRHSASECLACEWISGRVPDELLMVDYLEEYVERRRNRMQNSFLHHE
ncbi:hypothetical protein L596_007924 [Steinernema carpocapsae]|uniref:Protein kinase domain-containing protein n=1 Tax=Steinernema carpocapsae TaxID=34508 RepID=A0A4U5PAZ3_STECR|nr:hypothetical protein L596_007924 [Steinernema carpocapsae]